MSDDSTSSGGSDPGAAPGDPGGGSAPNPDGGSGPTPPAAAAASSGSVDLAALIAQYSGSSAVSRQNPDANSASGLGQPLEVRFIVLGQGISANVPTDSSNHPPTVVNRLSNGQISLLPLADRLYFYACSAQQVMYLLYITNDKSVFRQAMATAGIMVIYAGHARHGQGPCFHPETVYGQTIQGEWWLDGDGGADNGLIRMGYPFIAMPVSDVLDCYYHAHPLTADQPKPANDPTLLHPKLVANYGAIQQYTVQQLSTDPAAVACLGDLLPAGPYWGLQCVGDDGTFGMHLVMICGWNATNVTPCDLAGVTLACKVFCDFGCSTLIHNYPIIRQQYGWTKNGDDNQCYWTDSPANLSTLNLWLLYLLSYNQQSDLWEPSCLYARDQANAHISAYGMTTQIH